MTDFNDTSWASDKPIEASGAVVYEDREPTWWEKLKAFFGLWEPWAVFYKFQKSPGPIPPGTYETRIESIDQTGNSLTIIFGDVKSIDSPPGSHSNGEERNGN